jgi:hypothetical protein
VKSSSQIATPTDWKMPRQRRSLSRSTEVAAWLRWASTVAMAMADRLTMPRRRWGSNPVCRSPTRKPTTVSPPQPSATSSTPRRSRKPTDIRMTMA